MDESIGHKALTGTVWATVDRLTSMVLQFAVNLVLARLLLPADFGIVGMLAIFMSVSQTLIDGGFASALIQRKMPSQADYSTIFYWNLTFSLLLYGVLFVSAPPVARFFNLPVLCPVLRVISLNLVVSALGQVQLVRMKKRLAFKRLAVVNLTSYAATAAVGVSMAVAGMGVWSLVVMSAANQLMLTLLYWILGRWHPSAVFSRASLRSLFGYGGYMLAAGVLQEVCRNVQGIIIGKRFSAAQMGLYSQAYKLDQVTSYALPQVLVQVLFPFFSGIQDDREKLIAMTGLGMRVIAALVFPLLGTLILVAGPLVEMLYGEQWLPCVPYFRILCVGGVFVCLQNVNFYAVAARGHSKALFRWSFYKWGALLVMLSAGMFFGMEGIMWAMVLSNLNIFLVNAALSSRLIGFSVSAQFAGIAPPLAVTLAAAVPAYLAGDCMAWWLCGVVYLAVYVALLLLLRLRVVDDVRKVVMILMKKDRHDD